MTLSGSIMAVLLFMLKPAYRNRLPKFAQYYLWLVVIAAFLVPVSKVITLPDASDNIRPAALPNNVVHQYVVISGESPFVWAMPGTDREGNQYKQDDKPTQRTATLLVTLFMYVYPVGATIVLFYSVISFYAYIRLHRRRNRPAGKEEIIALERLCVDRRAPLLYRNPLAATPMLIGVLRPAIILPDREYTDNQLQAVLLHELTHLKRKDMLIRWLTVLACAVHWFNPVVWLVRHEIDRACELSCDEAVISGLDREGKQNYGDTLIFLASETKLPKSVISTTMYEEKKALKERLGAIMKSRKRTRAAVAVSIALIIAASGAASVIGSGSRNPQYNLQAVSGGLVSNVSGLPAADRDNTKPTSKPEVTAQPMQPGNDNNSVPSLDSNETRLNPNAGQQSWLLDPEEVALRYAEQTLNYQGTAALSGTAEKEYARVIFTKLNGDQLNFDLYQPIIKGKDGIWAVDGWYDSENSHYQVRDLTALPPLFYNDDNVPPKVREAVRNAIVQEYTEAFGAYYQVLGFEASQVTYIQTGNEAELKFGMTMVTKNFDIDPDTVDYIKAEKEKDLAGYQRLYQDYVTPKTGNFQFRVTMSLTASGDVEPDTLWFYPRAKDFLPAKSENS